MVKRYIGKEIHCTLKFKGERFNFIAMSEKEVLEITEIITIYLTRVVHFLKSPFLDLKIK